MKTIQQIQKAVCSICNVQLGVLLSATRQSRVSTARHIAIFLCREVTGEYDVTISTAFNRERSLVAYSVKSVEKRRKSEPRIDRIIKAILKRLK